MHTVKKYAFYVQLLCFVLLVNSSHENTAKNPAFYASKVNISDNFVVEWRVNDTVKNVEFKVNVTIDEKGWVLLGFMPTPKNKSSDKNPPMKLSDTRGDFLITWPSSSSERTTLVRDFLTFVEEHVLYIGPYQHTCVYNDHDIREGFRYRHYLFSKQAKTQWVSPCWFLARLVNTCKKTRQFKKSWQIIFNTVYFISTFLLFCKPNWKMSVLFYVAWRNKNWSWIIAASLQNFVKKNITLFRVTPNWALGSHCTAAALIPVLWHDVILGLATRIWIFWIRNCFFFSWHGLRPHTFGEFGSESGYFLILHSQTGEEKDKSATSPTTCGHGKSEYSDDVAKSFPVSYRTIKLYAARSVQIPSDASLVDRRILIIWIQGNTWNWKETVTDSKISGYVWKVP